MVRAQATDRKQRIADGNVLRVHLHLAGRLTRRRGRRGHHAQRNNDQRCMLLVSKRRTRQTTPTRTSNQQTAHDAARNDAGQRACAQSARRLDRHAAVIDVVGIDHLRTKTRHNTSTRARGEHEHCRRRRCRSVCRWGRIRRQSACCSAPNSPEVCSHTPRSDSPRFRSARDTRRLCTAAPQSACACECVHQHRHPERGVRKVRIARGARLGFATTRTHLAFASCQPTLRPFTPVGHRYARKRLETNQPG